MADDYKKAFQLETRHLVELARKGKLDPVDFRDDEIAAVLEHLDARRSVLLVGPAGVGKSAVIRGVAAEMARREKGELSSLSTSTVLTGTRYLGEWQSKLSAILKGAADTQAALHFTDLYNLPSAGRSANDETNLLDGLRSWLEEGRVAIVGEVTPEMLRHMERVPGFTTLFETVVIEPLSSQAVDGCVARAAERLDLKLADDSRQTLVKLTTRFLGRQQPGPALDLLRQVRDYEEQKRGIDEYEPISPAFVEKVFSIYSGLPLFIVSRHATRSAEEIRSWFRERIVGQQEPIEAVVQAIALFKAGLNDPDRPLGTFLFVGPTGVGKTELARAMATYLYGSPQRLLRFDLSEFKDYHAFEQLLGDPKHPERPARLVDPVRTQPFQVILLDEIEKAHANVWDVLLGLLDEGRLSTPSGETVDFRSTFVVATSNVGAQESERKVGFGGTDPAVRRQRMQAALEAQFRPELLNRFQHVAFFHPLDERQVRSVARQELKRILERDGITGRNLVVDVDDQAIDLVVTRGYDPRYGARALKREVQRQIVMPLAMVLLEQSVVAGEVLKVTGREGTIRVRRLDTEQSRVLREELRPVRVDGKVWTRPELAQALAELREAVAHLADAADEEYLATQRNELTELRQEHAFWQDPERAARTLRDLDRATMVLDRLDRLRARLESFDEDLRRSITRDRLAELAERVAQIEDQIAVAWRELVHMGAAGTWDALVEIRPIGPGRMARDLLVRVYTSWASAQGMEILWLQEPRDDEEPALIAIKGRFAYGLLRLEAGVHKVRDGDDQGVARVRVAAWTDKTGPVVYEDHQALKAIGAYGGKIRSRLVCAGGLVLQNNNTLAENRDLASQIAGAWAEAPLADDAIVRRYDLGAPLVRDVMTDITSGRPDAVSPERFHELLCRRVEAASEGPDVA